MACYQGGDREDMKTAGDHAALPHNYMTSSSFTPINRPVSREPRILLSWNAHTLPPTLEQPKFAPLDETVPPSQIDLAVAVSPKPLCGSKRTRKKKTDGDRPRAPKQRCVSDGLQVTKPITRKTKSNIDTAKTQNADSKSSVPEISHGLNTTDDEFDDIFNSIDLDSPTNTATNHAVTTNEQSQKRYPSRKRTTRKTNTFTDAQFEDDAFFLPTPDSSSPVVHTTTLLQGTPVTASKASLRKFISPTTPNTQTLVQKLEAEQIRKPIVRTPFPSPVRDHSPIIGLSPSLFLRTCFRTGEAINQASHATKHKQRVMFELYARVLSSHRDEKKQYFTFADLFHDKPPYIKGAYEGAIWKNVQLYDYDSKRLLRKNTMCRCIGEIKRNDKEWIMQVYNIWESTWEDIEWVEGIIKE